MKKIFILTLAMLTLVSCNNLKEKNIQDNLETTNNSKTQTLQITTSIIPLASIANYIGWDYVEAKSLVPVWVSPHWFDIKPNQMVDIEKSDLIVYLWLEHIDWFLNKAIENKNNVIAVKKWIEFIESTWHEHEDIHNEELEDDHTDIHKFENEHGHQEEQVDEHEEHSTDPHIWTKSENAYIIAKSILDKLSSITPENKDYYETNFESFKKELETAKNNFKEKTLEKKQNNFIVFHDAYNYLFDELNIDNQKKHIFKTNILSDPNSNEMKILIDEITQKEIKVAFKEPQLDSNNLKKLSVEYNLEILSLDPLWDNETSSWYINNYKNNLESLKNIYE